MDATNTVTFWNRLFAVTGGILSLGLAYACLNFAQALWSYGMQNGNTPLGASAVALFFVAMVSMAVGVVALCGGVAWRGLFTGRKQSF